MVRKTYSPRQVNSDLVTEEELKDFQCPNCGFDVNTEYNECPSCGVQFEYDSDPTHQIMQHIEESEQLVMDKDAIPFFEDQMGYPDSLKTGIYGSYFKEILRKVGTKSSLPILMVPMEDTSGTPADADPTLAIGFDGRYRADLVGLPSNKMSSMAIQSGMYDPIAKTVHALVAARAQLLTLAAMGDSAIPDSELAAWPESVALDPVTGPSIGCYQDSASVWWRRITFLVLKTINAPAYIVDMTFERTAYPPGTGNYFVTVNDELDENTGESTRKVDDGGVTYRAIYGINYQLVGVEVENVTVHTQFILNYYNIRTGAY